MCSHAWQEGQESFLTAFTLKMSREHGASITVKFHNGYRTYCKRCGDPETTITYGRETIKELETELGEYTSLEWIWRAEGGVNTLIGKKGLWACAIHEFAHVLQQDRIKGIMHTRGWVVAVQELQTLYPFEEICDAC